jgi:hypothetical protein
MEDVMIYLAIALAGFGAAASVCVLAACSAAKKEPRP